MGLDDGPIVAGMKVANYRRDLAAATQPPTYGEGSSGSSAGGSAALLVVALLAIGFFFGPFAAIGAFVGLLALHVAFKLLGMTIELVVGIVSWVFSLSGLVCIGAAIAALYWVGTYYPEWLGTRPAVPQATARKPQAGYVMEAVKRADQRNRREASGSVVPRAPNGNSSTNNP